MMMCNFTGKVNCIKMPVHCSFNSSWLKHDSYKDWLVQDKTKPSSTARCKICLTSFNVSNMGEAAVKSHMKGAKHSQLFKQVTTAVSVKDYSRLLVLVSQQDAHKKSEDAAAVARDHGGHSKQIQATLTTAPVHGSVATKTDVLSAQLLWTMKLCSTHYSHNSYESSGLLFEKMFPESAVASSFTCGEMKSSYLICIILLFVVCRALCLVLVKINAVSHGALLREMDYCSGKCPRKVRENDLESHGKVMEFCDPTFVGTLY
jgi:hypothetical protein